MPNFFQPKFESTYVCISLPIIVAGPINGMVNLDTCMMTCLVLILAVVASVKCLVVVTRRFSKQGLSGSHKTKVEWCITVFSLFVFVSDRKQRFLCRFLNLILDGWLSLDLFSNKELGVLFACWLWLIVFKFQYYYFHIGNHRTNYVNNDLFKLALGPGPNDCCMWNKFNFKI